VIGPGAAYRRDEIDATHLSQFNQLEGLYVDRNVSVADLKGTLEYFVRELLGQEVETRLRPHFFPFTEPSFEVDIRVPGISGGAWMELLGCGMVNPAVFESVNERRGDQATTLRSGRVLRLVWAWSDWRCHSSACLISVSSFENDQRFLTQFVS